MLATFRQLSDRFLGRGDAAITVPVMDGALKPNRALDEAQVVAHLPGLNDLASDGRQLWMSAGNALFRLDQDSTPIEQLRFDRPITALALQGPERLAVALGGSELRLLQRSAQEPAWRTEASLQALAGTPLLSVNALSFDTQGRLLFSEGSSRHGTEAWCHDLMALGRTGRVGCWTPGSAQAELLAQGLRHAFGVLALGSRVLVSESWHHRVLDLSGTGPRQGHPLSAELVGYPSRMAVDDGGGFWLSCFVCRSQLVEFVLREPAYRQRMMAEIDPRHWIAPALSSGHSFLEPLQGAGVKQMGVLKPWAPPRSYGLVLRVAADGRVLSSLHSQVDGQHHGITAVTQVGRVLYVASRGAGRLLRLDTRPTGSQT